jgi:DNA-binding NarL/FixJ family response regulator
VVRFAVKMPSVRRGNRDSRIGNGARRSGRTGGEPILSPTVTRRLIGHVTDSETGDRRRHAREQLDRLTEREREVAVAIGLGKSNAEIGRELYMSVAMVKAHVSRVFEKLELNNRVQIALLAHDAGEARPSFTKPRTRTARTRA